MSELYHHGVKGQKWGVRRQKVREFVRSNSISRYTQKLNQEKKSLTPVKKLARQHRLDATIILSESVDS